MVNVRPFGVAMKPGMMTILFAWRAVCTPLPGAPLSTKYGRQSTEGGARGGRLSVDGACNQEPDGDTRRKDNDLDRFGTSDRRNTLHPVSLVYCINLDGHVDVD